MAKTPDTPFTDDKAIGLPDISANEKNLYVGGGIMSFVEERFERSKTSRRFDEERWLRAYRQYRGIYGTDMKFTEAEKSRVFLKITKTKVLAAYGQVTDVLFANNSFPLSVEPTTLPEGVAEHVHIETNPQLKQQQPQGPDMGSLFGYKGDGKELPPGSTAQSLMERLGPLKDSLEAWMSRKAPV
jgi:hypothetical protein